MNIMNRVTLQYLKKNRRRTIVTILGVIISTAMIAAVSTFADSFMDLMRRDSIHLDGEWHVQYLSVSPQDAESIRRSEAVKLAGYSRIDGFFRPAGDLKRDYEYLFIQQYDQETFSLRNIRLTDGRLPQSSRELVITDQNEWGLKPGDTVSGELGDRVDKESGEIIQKNWLVGPESFISRQALSYTVVGVFEELRPSYNRSGDRAFTLLEEPSGEEPLNVAIRLAKVGRDVYKEPWGFGQYAADGVNYNDNLLRYMGILSNDGMMSTLYTAAGIVTVIILVGSVLLIYNAFAISIAERGRQLGMLSSVGATRKQKRNSVFFEGFLIGAAAIPLGIFFGILGIGITFTLVSPLLQRSLNIFVPFQVKVSPPALIGAVFFSALTIFISVLRPALRASKITPIEAIRQTHEVSLTGRSVKTFPLIRRLFGFEGDLALKNLKRQKKRYRTTILSLTVSILLFLTASAFSHYLTVAYELTNDQIRFDITMQLTGYDREQLEETAARASALPGVENAVITPTSYLYGFTDIPKELVAPETSQLGQLEEIPGKSRFGVSITTMDDAALERYCEAAGIERSILEGEGNPAILIDPIKFKENGVYREVRQLQPKPGGGLDISCTLADSQVEYTNETAGFRIVAQTPEVPIYLPAIRETEEELILVVSHNTYWSVFEWFQTALLDQPAFSLTELYDYYVYASAADPEAAVKQMELLLTKDYPELGGGVYNQSASRVQMQQLSTLMSIFLYGFIILITLISVANIFNTISTSVALRQREFAVLKSVGMTPRAFHRMIRCESLFYGLKALLYGIPLGFVIMYLLYKTLEMSFIAPFSVPWLNVFIAVAGVFLIVGLTMLYSGRKVGGAKIVDALIDENL